MMSFIHKYIMAKLIVKQYINISMKNVHGNIYHFMGNYVFFHDKLLEKWLKMSKFEFISRDPELTCQESDIQLNGAFDKIQDQVDCALFEDANLNIIVSKEKTSENTFFEVYVYNGEFLKAWFDQELHTMIRRVVLIECSQNLQKNKPFLIEKGE